MPHSPDLQGSEEFLERVEAREGLCELLCVGEGGLGGGVSARVEGREESALGCAQRKHAPSRRVGYGDAEQHPCLTGSVLSLRGSGSSGGGDSGARGGSTVKVYRVQWWIVA